MNQENKKYTVQQFGSIIKQKYPQYSNYDDEVIGKETLVNHPEYQSKIAAPPKKESAMSSFFNQPQDPVSKYAGGAIKEAFSSGVNQIKTGHQQFQNATNPIQAVEGVTNGLAGVVNTAFSPVAPITKPIEMGVNYVGDKISNSPKVQKFAESPAGKLTLRVAEDVSNVNTIAGAVAPAVASSLSKAALTKAKAAFEPGGTTANTVAMHDAYIKNGDFLPSDVYQSPGGVNIYKPQVAQQIVSDGVNYLKGLGMDKLANEYQGSFGDFSKVTPKQVLQNGLSILSNQKGPLPIGIKTTSEAISKTPKPILPPGGFASNLAKDIIPGADNVVNYAVTQALDLTPGDLKNIQFSTGNAVGQFMADRNLIGKNKETTIKNLNDFSKLNYDAVRAEINQIDKTYNNVPRYKEALTAIKTTIQDVPGLQAANTEVDALLKIKKPTLSDVQRVKELMDEHFSLYKATGDVKESATKEGLANIRDDLKTFIENRVEEETGADIRSLNNNVATAKSILGSVEERNTRALTRSMLRLGDLGVFGMGMGFGGPLVGAAAVFAKKLIASPTALLTFSKWLDGRSDAVKARIKNNLEAGVPPKDFQDSSSQPTNLMTEPSSLPMSNSNIDSIDPNGSIPSGGSQGGMKMPNVINPQDTSNQNKEEKPSLMESIKGGVKKFFGVKPVNAQTVNFPDGIPSGRSDGGEVTYMNGVPYITDAKGSTDYFTDASGKEYFDSPDHIDGTPKFMNQAPGPTVQFGGDVIEPHKYDPNFDANAPSSQRYYNKDGSNNPAGIPLKRKGAGGISKSEESPKEGQSIVRKILGIKDANAQTIDFPNGLEDNITKLKRAPDPTNTDTWEKVYLQVPAKKDQDEYVLQAIRNTKTGEIVKFDIDDPTGDDTRAPSIWQSYKYVTDKKGNKYLITGTASNPGPNPYSDAIWGNNLNKFEKTLQTSNPDTYPGRSNDIQGRLVHKVKDFSDAAPTIPYNVWNKSSGNKKSDKVK